MIINILQICFNWEYVYQVLTVTGGWNKGQDGEEEEEEEEDDGGDAGGAKKEKTEEKQSLKEKMQQMQDITLMVQNMLGMVAHIIESVANVFNFCVPFISWLGLFFVTIATLVLYYIPIRYACQNF